MAAIVSTAADGSPHAMRVIAKTAQATTGQTTWVKCPQWAKYARVLTNVTATAGTTPISITSLVTADPITADDTNTVVLCATTGGITSTGLFVIDIGPGVTGIADVVAEGATGGKATCNAQLPQLLGIKVLNDRTTGDETYTYTVTIEFDK